MEQTYTKDETTFDLNLYHLVGSFGKGQGNLNPFSGGTDEDIFLNGKVSLDFFLKMFSENTNG